MTPLLALTNWTVAIAPPPSESELKPKSARRWRPVHYGPVEVKVTTLRDCAIEPFTVDTPEAACAYWARHVATWPWFDPMKEHLVAIYLNARRYVLCHHLVAIGGLDGVVAPGREVYRPGITISAHAAILLHNHPSGHVDPSSGDIRTTRDLRRAGDLLGIELLDHIVVNYDASRHTSIKALGYFN